MSAKSYGKEHSAASRNRKEFTAERRAREAFSKEGLRGLCASAVSSGFGLGKDFSFLQ